MPKETFRVKTESGKWIDVHPSELVEEPLVHHTLSDSLLSRIALAYDMLREVITYNEHRMSLEQFEVGFMREPNPDATLDIWLRVGSAYQTALSYFPNDPYTKQQIYRWLILLVMGSVTDEDRQKEEVRIISECFAAVLRK